MLKRRRPHTFKPTLPAGPRRRKAVRTRELDNDLGDANMMFALGDLDGAMASVHAIMIKAPYHAPAFRLAALIFEERGQRANAIDALRLAVDADRRDVAAFRQLGILLREEGRLREAAWHFDRTVSRDPLDLTSLIDAAECYERCGLPTVAVRRYRAALSHAALAAPAEVLLRLATLATADADDVGAQSLLTDAVNLCLGASAAEAAAPPAELPPPQPQAAGPLQHEEGAGATVVGDEAPAPAAAFAPAAATAAVTAAAAAHASAAPAAAASGGPRKAQPAASAVAQRSQVLRLIHDAARGGEEGGAAAPAAAAAAAAAADPATLPPRPDLLTHGLLAVHRLAALLADAGQHAAVLSLMRRATGFLALAAAAMEGGAAALAPDVEEALTRVSAGLPPAGAVCAEAAALLSIRLLPPDLLAQLTQAHLRLGDLPSALAALDELWPGFRACCDAVTLLGQSDGGASAARPSSSIPEVLAAAAPALVAMPPPPVCFWDALAVSVKALAESGHALAAAAAAQRIASGLPALASAAAEVARPGAAPDTTARVLALLTEDGLLGGGAAAAPPPAQPAAAAAAASAIEPELAASVLDVLVTTVLAAGSPLRAAAAAIIARRLFTAASASVPDAPPPADAAPDDSGPSLGQRWRDALGLRVDWILPCALVRCSTEEAGGGEAGASVAAAGLDLLSAKASQAAAELHRIDEDSRVRWEDVPRGEGADDADASGAAAAAAPTRKRISRPTDWSRFTPHTSPLVQLVRAASAAASGRFFGPAIDWLYSSLAFAVHRKKRVRRLEHLWASLSCSEVAGTIAAVAKWLSAAPRHPPQDPGRLCSEVMRSAKDAVRPFSLVQREYAAALERALVPVLVDVMSRQRAPHELATATAAAAAVAAAPAPASDDEDDEDEAEAGDRGDAAASGSEEEGEEGDGGAGASGGIAAAVAAAIGDGGEGESAESDAAAGSEGGSEGEGSDSEEGDAFRRAARGRGRGKRRASPAAPRARPAPAPRPPQPPRPAGPRAPAPNVSGFLSRVSNLFRLARVFGALPARGGGAAAGSAGGAAPDDSAAEGAGAAAPAEGAPERAAAVPGQPWVRLTNLLEEACSTREPPPLRPLEPGPPALPSSAGRGPSAAVGSDAPTQRWLARVCASLEGVFDGAAAPQSRVSPEAASEILDRVRTVSLAFPYEGRPWYSLAVAAALVRRHVTVGRLRVEDARKLKSIKRRAGQVPDSFILLWNVALGFTENGRHGNALGMYLTCFDLQPGNAAVSLCLATTLLCIQSKAKFAYDPVETAQGLAYLANYARLRLDAAAAAPAPALAIAACEVAFNVGRYFHHLKLWHLARGWYRRCLGVAGVPEGVATPQREAAHNLILLLRHSGGGSGPGVAATAEALEIAAKHLVL